MWLFPSKPAIISTTAVVWLYGTRDIGDGSLWTSDWLVRTVEPQRWEESRWYSKFSVQQLDIIWQFPCNSYYSLGLCFCNLCLFHAVHQYGNTCCKLHSLMMCVLRPQLCLLNLNNFHTASVRRLPNVASISGEQYMLKSTRKKVALEYMRIEFNFPKVTVPEVS